MKRWAIAALAGATASAGCGAHAADNVSIYGFLKVNVESVAAGGIRQQRISNDLSVLGLRGTEDLGGGLQGFFQIEMPVAVDTGGGGDFTRNTAVGLRGSFGQVLLGIWESPYRYVSVYAIDPFAAGIFASNAIMGNGFATAANAVAPASFDRRQKNLVQYSTPSYRGWNARVAASAREEKNGAANPGMEAALVTYEDEKLYLAYGAERHRDYFATRGKDTGHKLGLAYSLGGTRLRAAFERLRYAPAPGQHLSRNAWQLAATHNSGPHIWRASLTRALDTKGNAATGVGGAGKPGPETGAAQYTAGYGYALSRRSELWAAYTRTRNEARAMYNLSANPIPGLAAGQDPSGFGVGITHKF
ncbi:porin [Massilia sp. Root418]|uniref:porin n=1 Tax=Massilia sp. Root418 TaxID=1736532 RepID=UPI0009E80220|nr:porin [Massilia sp. Root418]